ncbi:MAG: phosphoribosyltransferase [Planctomycetaceae bacterium]
MTHATQRIFVDRAEAGWLLVERLRGAALEHPLVLAIPRGGVEVGAVLARGLGAELDIVLSRKLRAPHQPEHGLPAGDLAELPLPLRLDGGVARVGHGPGEVVQVDLAVLVHGPEREFRLVRPRATIAGRTVILTDDGIATGATMIAALHWVRAAGAKEIIVAVPVGSPDRLDAIRPLCDRLVCLEEPDAFWAIGQFYRDFEQVEDARVVELLRDYGLPATKWERATAGASH